VTSPENAAEEDDVFNVLMEKIAHFGHELLGESWMPAAFDEFAWLGEPNEGDQLQLLIPWVLFHRPVDGQTVAARYLAEKADLSELDRTIIGAHGAAWLSVWAVHAIEDGCLRLRDLLSGERRTLGVAPEDIEVGDAVLGYLLELPGGSSELGGVHPDLLSSSSPSRVTSALREELGLTGDLPVSRLADPAVACKLIELWAREVREIDAEDADQGSQ
jgi:hypothetical protein